MRYFDEVLALWVELLWGDSEIVVDRCALENALLYPSTFSKFEVINL